MQGDKVNWCIRVLAGEAFALLAGRGRVFGESKGVSRSASFLRLVSEGPVHGSFRHRKKIWDKEHCGDSAKCILKCPLNTRKIVNKSPDGKFFYN